MSNCTTTATTMEFTIEVSVNVSVTITEVNGALQFDLAVVEGDMGIGDLNALLFDLNDDSLTNGQSVSGDDVTGTKFKINGDMASHRSG